MVVNIQNNGFYRAHRVILVLLLGICTTVVSQDERTLKALRAEADKYYEAEQYHLAIQYYRELADLNAKDPALPYQLAECYRNTFNYPEAEAYYLKVHFLAPEQYPLALYYYALMLKFNGNYDESITYFGKFIAQYQKSKPLQEYVEQSMIDQSGCETAKEELSNAAPATFIALNLNTSYNDYAPAVRDSTTLVITSGRVTSNRQSIDERFGEGFTDNYYFQKQGGVWSDKTKQIFSITNTRYNDGSGCFNSNGDKYYFTVCGMGGPQCRLFVTAFKNGRWSEPLPLNANINYKSFESKHPAISNGGDTLVFSSDRPGGFGKFDLWMSINSGNEEWGPPMNLGISVNTKLNELSPTFTAFQNVLFFGSDGHEGYGGVDLYMVKLLSTGETVLYNLGPPFNSNRDDCFISFSQHELYWSSNRLEAQGGFDVMAVKIPSVISFISRLSLKKRNARRDINLKSKIEEAERVNIQASRIEEKIDYDKLTYEKKQIVEQMILNRMRNEPIESHQFSVTISEFEILKRIAEKRIQDITLRQKGYLTRINGPANADDLSVTGVLADSLSGAKRASQTVMLTDQSGDVLKITKTNEDGKFKFTDIPSNQEYYLKLEKSTDPIDIYTRILDLAVAGTVEKQTIHFENIYFDFDHYRVRPEARKVLDELANHLIHNPDVQVEIFAFADDRGTSEYNLRLTQKRGQFVMDYLTQKGVDQTALAIIAKGKQAPRQVDLELQRQFNRRVEFYLNGNSDAFKENARTYILKKKSDWATIAEATGISKEILKELNGAGEEQVKAFQPVRIPPQSKPVAMDLFFNVR